MESVERGAHSRVRLHSIIRAAALGIVFLAACSTPLAYTVASNASPRHANIRSTRFYSSARSHESHFAQAVDIIDSVPTPPDSSEQPSNGTRFLFRSERGSARNLTAFTVDTIVDPQIESDAEFVSYSYAPGVLEVDEPIEIHKGSETVIPHTGWRGILAMGTYPDGTPSDCAVANPCTRIDWPAMNVTTDGAGYNRAEPSTWYGSLASTGTEGSGLQYMRNRYYDPKRAQFTQADPIGLAGGLNLYGFAEGDAINFADPLGLRPLTSQERRALGNMCKSINCDKVQVYDGHDGRWANVRRGGITRVVGASITLGYSIFIADNAINKKSGYVRPDVLVHEMTHVGQYERWGAVEYYMTGGSTQLSNSLMGKLEGTENPEYQVPMPVRPRFNYGMEQRAEIVRLCSIGRTAYCAASPYKF